MFAFFYNDANSCMLSLHKYMLIFDITLQDSGHFFTFTMTMMMMMMMMLLFFFFLLLLLSLLLSLLDFFQQSFWVLLKLPMFSQPGSDPDFGHGSCSSPRSLGH